MNFGAEADLRGSIHGHGCRWCRGASEASALILEHPDVRDQWSGHGVGITMGQAMEA